MGLLDNEKVDYRYGRAIKISCYSEAVHSGVDGD